MAAIKQAYGKLPAKDVGRARTFYAEKLGLEPYGEHSNHLASPSRPMSHSLGRR